MSELVPERLLSRASSIDFFGSIGLTPVGYVLAGARRDARRADDRARRRRRGSARVLWFAPLTWRRVRAKA